MEETISESRYALDAARAADNQRDRHPSEAEG